MSNFGALKAQLRQWGRERPSIQGPISTGPNLKSIKAGVERERRGKRHKIRRFSFLPLLQAEGLIPEAK